MKYKNISQAWSIFFRLKMRQNKCIFPSLFESFVHSFKQTSLHKYGIQNLSFKFKKFKQILN